MHGDASQEHGQLVGRDRELGEISEILLRTGSRLLTVLGPGGSGKTRLALELADRLAPQFAHGAHVIYLQPLTNATFLAPTIASALNIVQAGRDAPEAQLVRGLRERSLLLVLDNYEHLLPDVSLIPLILEQAPGVRLLVTSREVLNLRDEWLYPLDGLAFPTNSPSVTEAASYSAVQLFIRQVQRLQRDFSLAAHAPAVARICRAVEGMPLGLELAASWARTLTCETIADEIERSLSFLSTNMRDFPARHRSMHAVFEPSWVHLTDEERNVFQCLAVFRGGFMRDAAAYVAGASLPSLVALVETSFLRVDEHGRYQIHELLRQYAEEHLLKDTERAREAFGRHAEYYAAMLAGLRQHLLDEHLREALDKISLDLENIHAAWQWAVKTADTRLLSQAIQPYERFCDSRGRYQEISRAIESAIESLLRLPAAPERDAVLAECQSLLGWQYIRRGRYGQASAAFDRSTALLNGLTTAPKPGFGTDPEAGAAMVSLLTGRYEDARRQSERAVTVNQQRMDLLNLLVSYHVLASATFAQGDYASSEAYSQACYADAVACGHLWMQSLALGNLGTVANARGQYESARAYFQTALQLLKEVNDPEGIATMLTRLGQIAWSQQRYHDAERLYKESAALLRSIDDRVGYATCLAGLGNTAGALGQYTQAADYYAQALEIGIEIAWTSLLMHTLVGCGDLYLRIGDVEAGAGLLTFVVQHGGAYENTRAWAQTILAQAGQPIAALADTLDLLSVGREAYARLKRLLAQGIPHAAMSARGHPSGLDEPLSERELEILRLLAEGLNNQDIAQRLVLALGTVKSHNHHIFAKLGARNRIQALARARQLRLI